MIQIASGSLRQEYVRKVTLQYSDEMLSQIATNAVKVVIPFAQSQLFLLEG